MAGGETEQRGGAEANHRLAPCEGGKVVGQRARLGVADRLRGLVETAGDLLGDGTGPAFRVGLLVGLFPRPAFSLGLLSPRRSAWVRRCGALPRICRRGGWWLSAWDR